MRFFCAACVALSIAHAAFADTTLEFDAQGDEQPQVFLVKQGKVLLRGGTEDMLYADGRITTIDHSQRGYFVMDPEKMAEQTRAMRGQMQAQMQQLQDELGPVMQQMQQQMQILLDNPDIPESQKAQIRQQLAQMSGGAATKPDSAAAAMAKPQPMTAKATGETREVRGIKCNVHLVTQSGRTMQEVCVATRKVAGVPEADYQALRSMFASMRKMAEEMMASMGAGDAGPVFPDFDGVPVEIKDLEDGTVSTLREVSTKSIDAAVFEVPAGYRQHDPFMQ